MDASKASKTLMRTSASMLIISLLMALSVFALLNKSAGWFCENLTVTATGMIVYCDNVANLVITKDPSDITNQVIMGSGSTEVTFGNEAGKVIKAAVFKDGKLVYPEIDSVSPTTGKVADGTTYYDAEKDVHYLEFETYIGTTTYDISFDELDATIVTPTESLEDNPHFRTASVCLYVNDVYKGKLCINNLNGVVKLFDTATVLYTNSPIKITLRCFFDGSLEDGTGKTYIRATKVSTAEFGMRIAFTAVNAQTHYN